MNKDSQELVFPEASLGLVSIEGELRRAGGSKAGELPRGCPACNREEGRRAASLSLDADLPLKPESGDAAKPRAIAVRLVIDYCPSCGRVYDVRCAAG